LFPTAILKGLGTWGKEVPAEKKNVEFSNVVYLSLFHVFEATLKFCDILKESTRFCRAKGNSMGLIWIN